MAVDVHQEVFVQEAEELLQELEESLLELEDNTENIDIVARIFRAMHTIKGSGAMFGFENIAHLVHDVETAYDMVRNGELKVTKEMLDYSLKSCDVIKDMLSDPEIKPESSEAIEILNFFRGCRGEATNAATSTVDQSVSAQAPQQEEIPEAKEEKTYRIRFKPHEDILMQGTNPESLVQELSEMGEHEIIAHTSDVPPLADMNPEKCYTCWDVILTTEKTENDIKDVFIFVEDDSEIKITLIDDHDLLECDGYKKLGEILMEKGDVSKETLEAMMAEKKMLGEMLVEKGLVAPDAVQSALQEQKHIKEVRNKKQAAESSASLRVPSEKLDSLVDLVGELVTVQARLNQAADVDANPELQKIAEEVERLVWELRDNTMSIRMLQIGTTFSKYKRLVRDLSKELGKDIELVTRGEDTELDKTVIEKLGDPLVHLVRNSVDHGVELPGAREQAGKPRKGRILLSAEHSGDSVLIKIQDDGKGLNRDVLIKKAIEKGLITDGSELSDKEAYYFFFSHDNTP